MRTRGPRIGPKQASRGSEKSHLLGASPCSCTPQGGPLYGWKKRGIFAAVGRARGVCGFSCTNVRCSHKGPRCLTPWRQRAAYCWMIVSCRVKGRRGHSLGDRGHLAFREFPGKFPAQDPGPQVYPAHSVCARVGVLLGSVPQRKSCGPLGGREGSCVHRQVPRDPVELL